MASGRMYMYTVEHRYHSTPNKQIQKTANCYRASSIEKVVGPWQC